MTPLQFVEQYLPSYYQKITKKLELPPSAVVLGLRFSERENWSVSLDASGLTAEPGLDQACLLVVALSPSDLDFLVELLEQAPAARTDAGLLKLGADRLELVKQVTGSVLLVAVDGDRQRQLLIVFGAAPAHWDQPTCTIQCELGDWLGALSGKIQLTELFLDGKLLATGDPRIAMALMGLFL